MKQYEIMLTFTHFTNTQTTTTLFSQAFHTPILLFDRISFCCRSVELFIWFCSEHVNFLSIHSYFFPEIGNPVPELKPGKLIIPRLQVPFSLWGLFWLQGVCLTPFHQNKITLYRHPISSSSAQRLQYHCLALGSFELDPFRKGTFVRPFLIFGRCVQIFDSVNEHNYQLSSIH